MGENMPSICLNMIVKNESHIIEKTLENICKHVQISFWIISDTGSTDNTVEIIQAFFQRKNIPGEIYFHAWKNFGHNRELALQACLGKSDYVLFFDADDAFTGNLTLPDLVKDAYSLKMRSEGGNVEYSRKLIVRNNGQYHWRGVLHEFLSSDKEMSVAEIHGDYAVISGRKGHRSQDPEKYLKDAKILEDAIQANIDKDLLARYAFYCAQSYRDAGMLQKAIEWYQKRTELGVWQEEIYVSYMELGLLFERLKKYMEASHYWQCGVNLDPLRAECWYQLARLNNWNKNYHLALSFARSAKDIKMPDRNRLFLGRNIYLYWCQYEVCINAFKLGYVEEAYQAFKKLLVHAPRDLVQRVIHQLDAYEKLIAQDHFSEVKALLQRLEKLGYADRVLKISGKASA